MYDDYDSNDYADIDNGDYTPIDDIPIDNWLSCAYDCEMCFDEGCEDCDPHYDRETHERYDCPIDGCDKCYNHELYIKLLREHQTYSWSNNGVLTCNCAFCDAQITHQGARMKEVFKQIGYEYQALLNWGSRGQHITTPVLQWLVANV